VTTIVISPATSYFSPSPEQSKELVVVTTYNYSYPFSSTHASIPVPEEEEAKKYETIHAILAEDNLYAVLGLTPRQADDENTLRRAYLSKSRQCHPEYVNHALLASHDSINSWY
jgi:hypothetical protein